jgi:hypothetical protein
MNPFTHAYSFETFGFYVCNVVMCQKVMRSADQFNEVLLSYQHPEDEDRDGLQNVGFFHHSTT